jgi:hypothetical protein
MLGKNLLWVAKQHGHSVEVMLRMYAAWLDGATDTDIHAIKQAMEKRPVVRAAIPDMRAAISAVNGGANRAKLIVIRPPESPESGSRLPVEKVPGDSSLRNNSKIKWRRRWDCSRLRRSSLAHARDRRRDGAPASCAGALRRLVEPKGSNPVSAIRPKNQKGARGPFLIYCDGGGGGIRTHVPELPDHPISSRRRYDHFGTPPVNLKFCKIYLSFYGH